MASSDLQDAACVTVPQSSVQARAQGLNSGVRRLAQEGDQDEYTPLLANSHLAGADAAAMSPKQSWWTTAQDVWLQGKGMILVMCAMFFGASMNVMTQFLEIKGRDGKGFNPFQVRVSLVRCLL